MDDSDRFLHKLLQTHQAPPLPADFADQTMARMALVTPRQRPFAGGVLALHAPHTKWLAFVSVLVLAWALQAWLAASTDDDLMHIDTLSMSSMLVL
ncbi:MAG: hypothetical protein EBQ82_02865 [Betaproteobacteria bacterium]|nr:hypothetical protein [Betaproteobacteria bacterium]NBY04351.1 hypothetical protein [Betaproteobacteria bacterium]